VANLFESANVSDTRQRKCALRRAFAFAIFQHGDSISDSKMARASMARNSRFQDAFSMAFRGRTMQTASVAVTCTNCLAKTAGMQHFRNSPAFDGCG